MHPKGQRKLRGTIGTKDVALLKEALSSAQLENCCVDEVHKEALRLYLNSYVVSPIRQVLNGLERRHNKKIEKEN